MKILQVLMALLSVGCLVSMSIYMLAACWSKSPVLFSISLRDTKFSPIQYVLIVGAGIGLTVCVFQGVEAMLYWVPQEWGFIDEDGEYMSYRTHLALLFAAVAIGWLIFISEASYNAKMNDILSKEVEGLRGLLEAVGDSHKLERLHSEFEEKRTALVEKRTDSGRDLGRYSQILSGPYPPIHPEDEEELMYRRLTDAARNIDEQEQTTT